MGASAPTPSCSGCWRMNGRRSHGDRHGHASPPPVSLWTKRGSSGAWPVRLRKITSAARFVSRYHRTRIRETSLHPQPVRPRSRFHVEGSTGADWAPTKCATGERGVALLQLAMIDAASQLAPVSKAGSISNRPVWRDSMAPYERPSWGRSLLDLATSVVPYVALSVLMYVSLGEVPYWVTLALAIPTAGFPDANLHRLPRLHPRLVSALAAGQPLGRPAERAARLPAVRELAPHPRRPSRHGRRSRPARHRRHPDADLR